MVLKMKVCEIEINSALQILLQKFKGSKNNISDKLYFVFHPGLTVLACYLQRLSHLNIETCKGISSIALSFNDVKINDGAVSSYFKSLNPPNQSGLPGCKLLQYLNVSNCTGMTIDSIETFVRAYGKFLNVSITSNMLVKRNIFYIFCHITCTQTDKAFIIFIDQDGWCPFKDFK